MTIPEQGARFSLAAIAISLALAAPALAAPAGDEYLPKVPKAAGKQVVAGHNAAGGTILEPAARGSNQGGDPAHPGDAQPGDPAQPASAGGSSGAGALLDPIVLLVIAGVIAATAGMILRRRQVAEGTSGSGAQGPPTAETSEHPTPDGGIVDGDDDSAKSGLASNRKDAA